MISLNSKFFLVLNLVFLNLGQLFTQSFELVQSFGNQSELKDVNGVAVADYDLDGDLDVFIVSVHEYEEGNKQTWSRLLQNNGEYGFRDATIEANLFVEDETTRNGWMGDRMAASWGDYDNDGYPDLFLANNGGDELWHNEGNGQFKRVTAEAGVGGCYDCYSSNGLWWDYDHDGDLDLYVSDWLKVNRQYKNNGDGTFTDLSVSSGLNDESKSWASLPIDVNKDRHLDLYVVNDFGDNILFLNNGNNEFRNATAEFGLEDDGDGMGVDVCDYNNDGNFDIYVTNIFDNEPNPFFVSNENGIFRDLARTLGIDNTEWGWGARFFDADHDLDEDLFVVNGMFLSAGWENKNVFFENVNGQFQNISNSLGVNSFIQGRGLEVFDYDLDGDLDMMVGNRDNHMFLYENTWSENTENNTNWLQIKLEGVYSNRDALGAVVSIACQGEKYYRYYSGTNLFGQSLKPVHFGLADHEYVDEIKVIWPNGNSEYFEGVASNQTIKLLEGTGAIKSRLVEEIQTIFFNIHPNPFQNQIYFTLEEADLGWIQFQLFDQIGRPIHFEKHFVNHNPHVKIEFSHLELPNGLYFYSLITETGTKSGSLVKE